MEKRYRTTNILKAVSIFFVVFQHSLQTNANVHDQEIFRVFGFNFWILQAVSVFVIVTGFHYSVSMKKQENELDWYRKDVFIKKFSRIILPYSFMFLCFLVYMLITKTGKLNLNVLFTYLKGGPGPGGYYTWILIQFLIVFPVIYYLVKRSPLFGSIFVLSVNILYEYAVFQGVIRSSFNRLCCIRLMTGLLLGILIYHYADELKKTVIPALIFTGGGIFLLYHSYGDYKTQFISSWKPTSFMGMAFSAGIVFWVINKEDKLEKLCRHRIPRRALTAIEYIGKATFHIFLAQQLWYCINLSFRNRIRARYVCIIDCIVCILTGCIFCFINLQVEKRIHTKRLKKRAQ